MGVAVMALLLAGVWIAILPGPLRIGNPVSRSTETGLPTQAQTLSSGTLVSTCSQAHQVYGNMTLGTATGGCTSYGFPSATLMNATLASRQLQHFIKQAYEYHLVYFGSSKTDRRVTYAVLNVTGTESVKGNWSTGYLVSYLGNYLVNATVTYTGGSNYAVTHVSSYALPDRDRTIAYDLEEVSIIRTALADPLVVSLMGGQQYYAEFVGPDGSGTDAGSRVVQFYQVNGTGTVSAFVNTAESTIFSTFAIQRISGECLPNGLVITDPWGAAGYSGCNA